MEEDSSPAADLTELGADLVEPAFDRLLTSEVIKDLPVLGSAVRIARTVGAIRDRIFAAKVHRFLAVLGDISEAEINEMLWSLKKDPELRDRVGATVLTVLDRLDELDKARLIGKAFRSYLRNRIDLAQCRRICLVVNSSFADDLETFIALPSPKAPVPKELEGALIVTGLYEASRTTVDLGGFGAINVSVSELGKLFHRTMTEP
jgi:hypothetical protein